MFQASIVNLIGAVVVVVSIFTVVTTVIMFSTVTSSIRAQPVVEKGDARLADVTDMGQTGVTLNSVPLMRMTLRIHGDGASWDVTIKQFIDLGNIPRIGERVRVLVDPTDHEHVTYTGLANVEF